LTTPEGKTDLLPFQRARHFDSLSFRAARAQASEPMANGQRQKHQPGKRDGSLGSHTTMRRPHSKRISIAEQRSERIASRELEES
jgi:hypothetical protein